MMSNSEYEYQPEREIFITIEQLKPHMERLIPLNDGEHRIRKLTQ